MMVRKKDSHSEHVLRLRVDLRVVDGERRPSARKTARHSLRVLMLRVLRGCR